MSILEWVILGLVAGFVGSKLFGKKDISMVDILLGMTGAVMAGLVYTKADALGITVALVYSVIVALAGAVIMLFTYHKILKH